MSALVISASVMAEDHVMAATHGAKASEGAAPKVLSVRTMQSNRTAV